MILLSKDLAEKLEVRRNNDVAVLVPLEGGGSLKLYISELVYEEETDCLLIVTERHQNVEEEAVIEAAREWRKGKFLVLGEVSGEDYVLGKAVDDLEKAMNP